MAPSREPGQHLAPVLGARAPLRGAAPCRSPAPRATASANEIHTLADAAWPSVSSDTWPNRLAYAPRGLGGWR